VKQRHAPAVALTVFGVVACMIVVCDRITKALAESALAGGAVQDVIPGILDFRLVYNTGAAWGMFAGAPRALFVGVAVAAVAMAVLYLIFGGRHSALKVLGLGLIVGGAIGNAIDRALSGRVVDFIHTLFIDFPLFNIADSAITIGVILFMFALIFGEREGAGRQEGSVADDGGAGDRLSAGQGSAAERDGATGDGSVAGEDATGDSSVAGEDATEARKARENEGTDDAAL
jgi:signal peptidase II